MLELPVLRWRRLKHGPVCRYFELSGQAAKEIDFNSVNPNKGCRFYLRGPHDVMKVPRLNDQGLATPSVTTCNVRRKPVQMFLPVALAWLDENKGALLHHGWTMKELYRRNKSKQGIAWMAIWDKPMTEVSLKSDGVIRFWLKDRGINQTA